MVRHFHRRPNGRLQVEDNKSGSDCEVCSHGRSEGVGGGRDPRGSGDGGERHEGGVGGPDAKDAAGPIGSRLIKP